jgi:hypothetical protein
VATPAKYSAFGALYTNDNKAELMIVVTVVICRLTPKYAQMQHPLFGMPGRSSRKSPVR